MPNKPTHDDANLILRLYDLRREERLRQARSWFIGKFKAKTLEGFDTLCPIGSEENASFRMVTSYWEMAASFLNSGVLDRELFYRSGNELLFIYLRLIDLIPALRERHMDPTLLEELEQAAAAMTEWKKSRAPEAFQSFSKRVRGA